MAYTIKEAAHMVDLPVTTLRYYDKEGLLPFVGRKDSGYRVFSDVDIMMLRIIECLKNTGMSIREIRQFTQWAQEGDETLEQRYQVFVERKKIVQAQMDALQKMMDLIDHKCWYYKTALEAGTEKIHQQNPADKPSIAKKG